MIRPARSSRSFSAVTVSSRTPPHPPAREASLIAGCRSCTASYSPGRSISVGSCVHAIENFQRASGATVSGARGPNANVVAWQKAARPILERVARSYDETITYGELGKLVQADTGIETKSLLQNWIGDVLWCVAQTQASPDEPMITSLVVDRNGNVGPGYADAVRSRYGFVPEDPEAHADEERLACYRFFQADVPVNARPKPSKHSRRRSPKPTVPTAKYCELCGVRLPLTGICDSCQGD